jgi:carboxypeptidase Q
MNVRRIMSGLSAVALIFAGAHYNSVPAAADATGDIAAADAQILAQIREHSELMPNLEYLSDNIGPRLTGSAQLKQANDWTADLFRKYGLSNVHLEPWTIAHSWTRGTASARIIAPAEHPLTIASAGWSPSTLGIVRGPVVYVDAKKKEELEKFR